MVTQAIETLRSAFPSTDTPTEPAVGDMCLVSTSENRYFHNPIDVYSTHEVAEVMSLIETINARVQSESLYAAGYLAYEAAATFDSALVTHPPAREPVLWFGLYKDHASTLPEPSAQAVDISQWTPSVSRGEFDIAIDRIRNYIAAGDTYQVNYTFPMYADFCGSPYAWFRQLCDAQRADYCTYLNTGSHVIMSASPELFFRLDGTRLTTMPMKGTIARGPTLASDHAQRDRLSNSQKDRAENIMIVDLVRNDMGRISETGTVRVESRFNAAKFDTLWQMTSTITSETHAEIPEVLKALFPSGSITGAPKIRTTQIIRELEPQPRGAYCGAIGYWGPDHQAEFNVAIRTATLNVEEEKLVYSVGAGITWDSSSEAEYAECLLKAEVVSRPKPQFDLLESLLWDGDYFLLERHLTRLNQSAEYFGFAFEESVVRAALIGVTDRIESDALKVRLLLSRNGNLATETTPIIPTDTCSITLAREPVDQDDVFLYHKTTHRSIYDSALDKAETDDVVLWNTRGEITESTRANVVIKRNGIWTTPPVPSGLLAGTYRAQLLDDGSIQEGIITKGDFVSADEVCLINSVRRWIPVNLLHSDSVPGR